MRNRSGTEGARAVPDCTRCNTRRVTLGSAGVRKVRRDGPALENARERRQWLAFVESNTAESKDTAGGCCNSFAVRHQFIGGEAAANPTAFDWNQQRRVRNRDEWDPYRHTGTVLFFRYRRAITTRTPK